MPEVYVLTVYAQEGKEEALSAALHEIGESLKATDGFMGRHVLRALPADPPPPEVLAQHAGERPEDHGPALTHFIVTEIWRDRESRARHRATPEFKAWYGNFVRNLDPQHTHGWYEDIAGH